MTRVEWTLKDEATWKAIWDAQQVPPHLWSQGWHFCYDWDYLLVAPGCPEFDMCHCSEPNPWPWPNRSIN